MPRTSHTEHGRREVSRVEGFSDAVFAFAITLLVVSLEVPRSFNELMHTMRGFPAFAVCFALLFQVWWRHYKFFRAYDLEDSYVIVLTGCLLFVVMFYVYPLKFLWSLPFAGLEGRRITDEVIRVDQARRRAAPMAPRRPHQYSRYFARVRRHFASSAVHAAAIAAGSSPARMRCSIAFGANSVAASSSVNCDP